MRLHLHGSELRLQAAGVEVRLIEVMEERMTVSAARPEEERQ